MQKRDKDFNEIGASTWLEWKKKYTPDWFCQRTRTEREKWLDIVEDGYIVFMTDSFDDGMCPRNLNHVKEE
jgi:hypothetical protein